LIDQGLQQAEQMYNNGGFNIQPYQGDMVAGFSGLQSQAQGLAPMVAGMGIQGTGAAQMAAMQAMDPNARSAAFDQVKQNTIADIMPAINGSFAGSGMTGSGLHAQNLAAGLSQGLGEVENNAWQQGQARSLQAAGMMPMLNNATQGSVDFLNQYGGQQQEQAQLELNARVLQDQQAQTGELNALQDYLALTTGAGSQFGVQSSTQKQGGGLAGALGFGLQAAPLLFSDRRLKENIKRVGATDDGLPIYTYTYVGSNVPQMGVMADELEVVNPAAVVEVNGYKAVNYGLV
jgi:hypothetical protein